MKLPSIPADLSQVDAKDSTVLKSKGNEAFNNNDYLSAGRMYTLALDVLLSSKDPSEMSPSDLHAADVAAKGDLHVILSNRSLSMLKQSDFLAAKSDAALCTLASPDFPKGWLRLLAALDGESASLAERREGEKERERAKEGQKWGGGGVVPSLTVGGESLLKALSIPTGMERKSERNSVEEGLPCAVLLCCGCGSDLRTHTNAQKERTTNRSAPRPVPTSPNFVLGAFSKRSLTRCFLATFP